jgi:hypothetical protein
LALPEDNEISVTFNVGADAADALAFFRQEMERRIREVSSLNDATARRLYNRAIGLGDAPFSDPEVAQCSGCGELHSRSVEHCPWCAP